jgi:hypothetical protein
LKEIPNIKHTTIIMIIIMIIITPYYKCNITHAREITKIQHKRKRTNKSGVSASFNNIIKTLNNNLEILEIHSGTAEPKTERRLKHFDYKYNSKTRRGSSGFFLQ